MCFSATASFTTAVVTSSIGVAAISKAKTRNELPFAAIPFFFGIQQLAEGLVWVSIKNNDLFLNSVASHVFVFFAYLFWPIYVPFAVYLLEKSGWRRKIIALLQVFGLMLASFFVFFSQRIEVVGSTLNKCIVYTTQTSPMSHPFNPLLMVYFAVTCFCLMISSHNTIKWFGFLASVFLIVAYLFYSFALISVWCFFAAVLSLIVYFYFSLKD